MRRGGSLTLMSIRVVGGEDKQTVSYVFSSQAKM